MDCRSCKTELSEMKNGKGETTCLRCLKCHPVTAYVPPAKKARRDVDLPWTDERVIEVIDRVVPDMIRDMLRNWFIQKPPAEAEELLSTTTELNNLNWRTQAKELGIEVYDKVNKKPRLKVEVLKDIEEKTNVSEKL